MVDEDIVELSEEDRRTLLGFARSSVLNAMSGVPLPEPAKVSSTLQQGGAAFVTLRVAGRLRGCLGTLSWDEPLYRTVIRMAAAAATDDHRFPPLQPEELFRLHIEISRLTPLRPATVGEIEVGQHGVSLRCRGAHALFLPKIATEYGWDRDTLLRELCRKAALADDAWQDPQAQFYTFAAEVFDDGIAARSEVC